MYLVDVTKGSNEGMATLVSSNTRLVNGISIGTMKAGNSVEVANIRIEVVFSNDQGDYIRVTKK
jgi:V8-like Glu-specific endopeptidase